MKDGAYSFTFVCRHLCLAYIRNQMPYILVFISKKAAVMKLSRNTDHCVAKPDYDRVMLNIIKILYHA